VEGILRQAADVEEVDRRLQEYEQGYCGYLVHICNVVFFYFWFNCAYNSICACFFLFQEGPSLHQKRMLMLLVTA